MPIKIFFCYAHEDEALLIRLKSHLKPLERQGIIETWYDREIGAGAEWEKEISQRLSTAQIILLLVSPDFMNSEYCYGTELKRALEKHKRGEAQVIAVIGRPVYWQGLLGQLQVLPKDALPVTDPTWYDQDRALYNVTEGLYKAANIILTAQAKPKGEAQGSVLGRQNPVSSSSSLPSSPLRMTTSSNTSLSSQLVTPIFPTPPSEFIFTYGQYRIVIPARIFLAYEKALPYQRLFVGLGALAGSILPVWGIANSDGNPFVISIFIFLGVVLYIATTAIKRYMNRNLLKYRRQLLDIARMSPRGDERRLIIHYLQQFDLRQLFSWYQKYCNDQSQLVNALKSGSPAILMKDELDGLGGL
jgi:hypothetical protein